MSSFKESLFSRKDLEQELERVNAEEAAIDAELREYFHNISQPRAFSSKRSAFDHSAVDITNNIKKVELFSPMLEVISQDSKKLVHQIDECRQLSDRLSAMVRRLDMMQMRSQQALACTEDVINLKDCKIKLQASIEDKDLQQAVQCIKLFHTIDLEAAKNSDDYDAILTAENETRSLVRDALNAAMASSDISAVVALCPLLQTLGLEVEARDNFLNFIESTVFIAVSADAGVSDNITDVATGYAQALSSVFNSTYLIFQKYLSLVIQGMENSLGDILFIRKLHAKCEKEAGLVLKRYMKYRNVKQVIANIKPTNANAATAAISAATGVTNPTAKISSSELHVLLDELTLLIQYCCLYAKYLKNLCVGAETKKRSLSTTSSDISSILGNNVSTTPSTNQSMKILVFSGATEFDKMIDELINKYYMDGEHYLLKSATKSCFPKNIEEKHDFTALDEGFYVLQRCGSRAIATNNIHAACAILHLIADLLTSEVAQQAREFVTKSTARIHSIFNEQIGRYVKSINQAGSDAGSLSIGLKSAMSLASSIAGASSSTLTNTSTIEDYNPSAEIDEDDPWRTAQYVEAFNTVERCIRYTERLTKDIMQASDAVFSNPNQSSTGSKSSTSSHNILHYDGSSISGEMDKIKLCKEDFDASKVSFQQVLRQGLEKLSSIADNAAKEALIYTFGKQGPLGGVRFDLPDDRFDEQLAISLLPKSIVQPFETIVDLMTFGLSDANKETLIGLLADVCVERLESYINQTTFRFAGALKFEECVRSITNIFTRASSSSIRGRFARLREILVVLTSDISEVASSGLNSDNFSHLTNSDVEAYLALRVDNPHNDIVPSTVV